MSLRSQAQAAAAAAVRSLLQQLSVEHSAQQLQPQVLYCLVRVLQQQAVQ
jgi:hypothetical protein